MTLYQKQIFEFGLLDYELDLIFLDIYTYSSILTRKPFFEITAFDNALNTICKRVQLYESSLICKRLGKRALTYLYGSCDCIDKSTN